MKFYLKSIIISVAMLVSIKINAQESQKRDSLLIEVANKIKEYYIFEDVANQLSDNLKEEIRNNRFYNLSDKEFADSLSSYLRNKGNDLHFNILYRPKYKENPVNEEELLKEYDEINRQWNYGFEKVERLDGNIGYIEYTGFPEGNKAAENVLDAAMNFVANTNALIIDLRGNRGGDGKMLELFLNYFIDTKTLLGKTYTRHANETTKSYAGMKVEGKKYVNKPLYILVNKNTISAAESLAYNLQQQKLATIVGEVTYGAANPVKAFFIDNTYLLFVPISEEQNAITGTNWEHTGVIPDIKIEAEKALIKAHIITLQNFLKSDIKTELTIEEITDKVKVLEQRARE